jgi:hypothetical protein
MSAQFASRGIELVGRLSWRMAGQFRPRYVSVEPMPQPTVKLAGRFAFDSFALAEERCSLFQLSGSGRSLFEVADERQQVS